MPSCFYRHDALWRTHSCQSLDFFVASTTVKTAATEHKSPPDQSDSIINMLWNKELEVMH